MPQITFLVHLNADDTSPTGILDLAGDIEEDLQKEGYDVTAVTPWARPSLIAAGVTPAVPALPQWSPAPAGNEQIQQASPPDTLPPALF